MQEAVPPEANGQLHNASTEVALDMDQSTAWERVQTVFHAALEQPREERWRFVEEACRDDAAALKEVLDMLEADAADSRFMDAGVAGMAQSILGDAFSTQDFGPYKLIHLLGEGGMGVVWLAERKDTRMRVAIKFLPHAGLSPARRERFTREIQLLSRLRHPSIARLYDAGSLEDGTPWFVMEYVEGLRLNDYSEEHALPLDARLQLFHQVCTAVQYAHGQAIVHRDLKPSNILVEADGTPRLLDFGIARELQGVTQAPGQVDGVFADQTRAGLRFYSPDYAAPEWIHEGTVGLYTDVYALGVLLYQLLTAALPFKRVEEEAGGKETNGKTDSVGTSGTKKSSATLSGARPSNLARRRFSLSNAHWKDLDVLCMKAMHSDWKQRYQSVEALLRDLDHYSRNEPLEARPDRTGYRLAKFVARNKRPLFVSVLVLVLLTGLSIFFTVRLARAKNVALAEVQRTHRIQRFMFEMIGGGSDRETGPEKDLKVETLLDRSADKAASLEADPETQGELYLTLGTMYSRLSNFPKAEKLLALALEKTGATAGAKSVAYATVQQQRAELLAAAGQLPAAEKAAQESLDTLMALRLPADDLKMLTARLTPGRVAEQGGDHARAIAILRPLTQLGLYGEEELFLVHDSLSAIAIAESNSARYEVAEADAKRALAMDRQLFGDDSPRTAEDLMSLGTVKTMQGHYAEAEQQYRRGVAVMEAAYGPDNLDAAGFMSVLARLLTKENKDVEAKTLFEKVLAIQQKTYTGPHERMAYTLFGLGQIAERENQLRVAEVYLTRGLIMDDALFGANSFQTAMIKSGLGNVYREENKAEQGEALLHEAVEVIERAPQGGPYIGVARARWGHALFALRRYPEAKQQLIIALEAMAAQPNASVSEIRSAREELAVIDARHAAPSTLSSH